MDGKKYSELTSDEKKIYHREKGKIWYANRKKSPKTKARVPIASDQIPAGKVYHEFTPEEKKIYHRERYAIWYKNKGSAKCKQKTLANRITRLEGLGYTIIPPQIST